jgi:hypothetical protein
VTVGVAVGVGVAVKVGVTAERGLEKTRHSAKKVRKRFRMDPSRG